MLALQQLLYFSPGRRQDLLPPARPRSRRETRHQGKAPVPRQKWLISQKTTSWPSTSIAALAQPAKEEECGKVRKDAVEIVKEDLHTLGSSADRTYMPTILKIFKNDDVELRIAAADAIGMIGPQDSDVDALIPLTNDPVPDVRRAVMQMVARGKGPALTLLSQRIVSMRSGNTFRISRRIPPSWD